MNVLILTYTLTFSVINLKYVSVYLRITLCQIYIAIDVKTKHAPHDGKAFAMITILFLFTYYFFFFCEHLNGMRPDTLF